MRIQMPLCALTIVLFACGDPDFPTNPHPTTSPTTPPGAATTGLVSAQIDSVPFSGVLLAASAVRNGRFGFGLSIQELGDLIFSVGMPAQAGTWDVGGDQGPSGFVTAGSGGDAQRWIASVVGGRGSVTVISIEEEAYGEFQFELVPDSAAVRAGVVATRMVTSGTFMVRVTR
jgi:hypothetical protein